jgi:hypothetical protein
VATVRASASALIGAPPAAVYSILADYRDGHPRILPKKYFQDLVVERGGVGTGTRIRFGIRLMGSTRTVRAEVSEPEPGRVLAEKDVETGAVTTFSIEPADNGRQSLVTITTEWSAGAVAAMVLRLFAPPALKRIYKEELRNLDREATRRSR